MNSWKKKKTKRKLKNFMEAIRIFNSCVLFYILVQTTFYKMVISEKMGPSLSSC